MLRGETLNVVVSGFEGLDERALGIAAEEIIVDTTHGFDRKATGLLATLVASHAVSNDGETAFAEEIIVGLGLPVKVGIFVIGPLTADIGQAGCDDARFGRFGLNSHRCGERVLIGTHGRSVHYPVLVRSKKCSRARPL